MNEQELYRIVAGVVNGVLTASPAPAAAAGDRIPVEISAKHVHLSQEHVEALFGAGYTLTPKRDLSQPGQFLCEERVTVVGPKGTFKNVAVLGPVRSRTQVELSATDARALGVKAPLRLSGDLAGCPGVFIQAGDAMVRADESVMVAQNHIHMTPADAQRLGVHDGEVVSVRMDTERPLTFDHVLVRATDTSALAMHIDFDEANACQLAGSGFGTIVRHAAGAPCAPVAPAPQAPRPSGLVAAVSAPAPAAACVPVSGLLSAAEAQTIASSGATEIRLEPGAVVTPLARDVLRDKRIVIRSAAKE